MAVFAGREWLPAGPAPGGGLPLRCVSYNVLAQCNIKAAQFAYATPEQLSWPRRSALLAAELRALDADVLLLQEIDGYDGESGWRSALAALGYASKFQPRTQAGGARGDGVCIAWRAAALQLRAGRGVEHNELATAAAAIGDAAAAARLRNRDNVGLVVALAPLVAQRGAPALFLVATTHTYWNPDYEDVKAAQAAHTLRCVANFAAELAVAAAAAAAPGAPPPPPPLLLGEDFNALPGSLAAAALANAAGATEPRLGPLRALYAGRMPAFTTATQHFSGAIDHLLASRGNVRVLRVLAPPTRDALGAGLPNATRPSDHLPLAADVVLLAC